jgi:hypothetical protein
MLVEASLRNEEDRGVRMRRRLVAALLLAALAAATPASAAPARPYALRNIAVGITLPEFRRLPYPDIDKREAVRVYCSNEQGAGGLGGLSLSPGMLQAGVVKCAYYEKGAGLDAQPVTATMTFLGENVTPIFLFYKPDGAPEYGLAQITLGLSNRRGGEIVELFYRAYGGPSSLDIVAVPIGFGGDLPDIRYIWQNDASSIQLDSVSVVLTEMSAVFWDNRLWGALSDRLATIDRMNRLGTEEEKRQREAEAKAKGLDETPAPLSPASGPADTE